MRGSSSGEDLQADNHQLAVALCTSLYIKFMIELQKLMIGLHVDCLLLVAEVVVVLILIEVNLLVISDLGWGIFRSIFRRGICSRCFIEFGQVGRPSRLRRFR